MMPNIREEIKTGKLTKKNGFWYVEYVAEVSGDNNWVNLLPLIDTDKESETVGDLLLVEKYNLRVDELEGLDVKWVYVVSNGVLDFGYEYAKLFR